MHKQLSKCDVIITYCWNRVGYNILRSLADKGLTIVVGDTSNKNICSISKYVSGNFVYPDPFTKEEEFIDFLLKKIAELQPKVLLPTHDESKIIAKHINRFPKDLIIPIESYQKLMDLSDKSIATALAEKAGVPCPKIYNSESEIQFPFIAKTKVGNSAKGVYLVKDKAKFDEVLSQHNRDELLLEEFMPGNDICVDCVRWGDFFYASVYEAILTKTDGGGTTTQRVIVKNDDLCRYAKMLLDYVDYNGVCGIDFRIDKSTGKVAFIEVNARYTGGLATPVAAGFDIPYIHYCLATTNAYSKPINLKIGTKTKWILGDIITLVSSICHLSLDFAKLKQILSFSGFDAFDDYRSDDKKIIWGEMSYYLNKLIVNRKLNP
jgi:predicted ATP-grasp superfamily ATP-dependent carboligase